MRKLIPLTMQAGLQNYDCAGCGECCRGRFAIVISEEDRDRIIKQNWDAEELGLGKKPLFSSYGDGFQLAHRKDGSCVFLTDDNRCRIHARHGEAAKPLACRLYPFNFVPLGSQIRVDLRYDCPTAAANHGRPIAEHKQYLQGLVNDALPEWSAGVPPPPLYGAVQLTWVQLDRITKTFERVLMDVSLDITRRVAACINLIELLRQSPFEAFTDKNLGVFLEEAASQVQQEAINDTLERVVPNNMQLVVFRQLLGAYGRLDHVGQKMELARRLSATLRMLAGKGEVPKLREGFPEISFADIENARGIPMNDAAQSLERYLHVHLDSMSFFGQTFYGHNYLDGMNALMLTYPFVCWFARAFAVSEGLAAPNASCTERAIMIVDHHRGVMPLLDKPSGQFRNKFLCERHVLRSLIVWYGS